MATSLEQYHLERLERESARSRSSTWPQQDAAPPLSIGEAPNNASSNSEAPSTVEQQGQVCIKQETPECESPIPGSPAASQHSKSESKKPRNAWGNMSYAELITQAILSTPEKRLTLSEIYDWIVKNVHYFSDKASSPSTAGWKNSVRHNLSLHSRFVKVQNDTSGKSSWWTVNLDAKSGRTSRRRSHSVDNTNAPSPKTRKREKRAKMKKVSKGSSTENILSSPCDSPTLVQMQPWSPNPSCPSPTGSDLSPCYSPSLQSPILHHGSRNVTPVSPLISPPGLDQQGANVFSGSNSSLLDSDNHTPDFGDPNACVDMLAQLNLRSSREHMGSTSSLSSLNSPRLNLPTKSAHPVFTFSNGPIDSSGYSSSAYFSDTDLPEPTLPPPPPYEEHLVHQPRPICYTPTRSGTHPLHIMLSADMARPRSGSEPVVAHSSGGNHCNGIPQDIDMDLIGTEFPDCDVETILQNEMQYNNGNLDFSFDQKQHTSMSTTPSPSSSSSTLSTAITSLPGLNHLHNSNNNANLRRSSGPTHHYHHSHISPPTHPQHRPHHTNYQVHHRVTTTSSGDPTLTSAALHTDPLMLQGHALSPAGTTATGYWAR